MSWNDEPSSWEPTHDILDYLSFAGVPTTRDQLARLHRRRLIGEPLQDQVSGRSSLSRYPAGTAERMFRISQLRRSTKQLDELAWRLWWEGFDIEPEMIRAYLLKRATRWDEQSREIHTTPGDVLTEEKGERDVLEEVFFEHLKTRPAMVSARRRLGRGSELFAEFSSLLIDVMADRLMTSDQRVGGLFDIADGEPEYEAQRASDAALEVMRDALEKPFIELASSLDDKEIANARPVALHFVGVISNVGGIVHTVFGGSGHGRDNVGRSLGAMAENSEEQVLAVLLTTSLLKVDRVREALAAVVATPPKQPAISFLDFRRLRYLAEEIASVADLLTPTIVADAFASAGGEDRWRVGFNEYFVSHYAELHEAMALRPDLFAEAPHEDDTEPPEPVEEVPVEVETKKKNLI